MTKAFAQFLTKNLRGETVHVLGTDGYLPLDARRTTDALRWIAAERGRQMNERLGKGFCGVEIHRGNLKAPQLVAIQYF